MARCLSMGSRLFLESHRLPRLKATVDIHPACCLMVGIESGLGKSTVHIDVVWPRASPALWVVWSETAWPVLIFTKVSS